MCARACVCTNTIFKEMDVGKGQAALLPIFHDVDERVLYTMGNRLAAHQQLYTCKKNEFSLFDFTFWHACVRGCQIELTREALLRTISSSSFLVVLGSVGMGTSASIALYISVKQFDPLKM